MPIRRRNHGRGGHSYRDEFGRVPGVTTILRDGFPKSQLIDWAGRTTAEYAVDHWDELNAMPPGQRLRTLDKARYLSRDEARDRGTDVHTLAVALIQGQEVEVSDTVRAQVEGYARFLDLWGVEPELLETTVVNYTYRYAGTLDLIVTDCRGVRWLWDLKVTAKGPYGDTAFQLVSYRFAEFFVDANGDEKPMPPVDRVGVVQIRADGTDLFELPAGEQQFRQFLYIQQVAIAAEESKDFVGPPLPPPRRS